MPFFSKDYFGKEYADISENRSAERIGERIKKIRQTRKLTRAELGRFVGLDQNRIQQYENGKRKPKSLLLKKIAYSLGVDTLALLDPMSDTTDGVMFMLFELEEKYDLKVEQIDGRYCLKFGDGKYNEMSGRLKEWYEVRKELEDALPKLSEEERTKKIFDYNMFEWTYPRSHVFGGSDKQYFEHPISRMQEIKEDNARFEKRMRELDENMRQEDEKEDE